MTSEELRAVLRTWLRHPLPPASTFTLVLAAMAGAPIAFVLSGYPRGSAFGTQVALGITFGFTTALILGLAAGGLLAWLRVRRFARSMRPGVSLFEAVEPERIASCVAHGAPAPEVAQ